MAVGDKVAFPFISGGGGISAFNVPACNQCGCLPLIGTVIEEPGTDVRVAWPAGQEATVPPSTLLKLWDASAFAAEENALSWFADIGKYVQLTDFPYDTFRQVAIDLLGFDPGPLSPAASGLLVQVYGFSEYASEDPDGLCAWIALQDGKNHIFVIGFGEGEGVPIPDFGKPYVVQPGRRSVGFGP